MRMNSLKISQILSPASVILAGALAITFSSCKKSPDGILGKEEMASLMADIHIAEAVIDFNYREYPNDSTRQVLKQSILAEHGINQDILDSSFVWYGHHIEDYIEVYDRTIEILQNRKTEYANSSSIQIAMAGDSVEVWTGPRHISLSPNAPGHLLSFDLQADSTWKKGDIYTLSYKTINNGLPVTARLIVDYTDGGSDYSDEIANVRSISSLKLRVDSTKEAERVYGYLSIPADRSITYELDSISLVRVRSYLDPYTYYARTSFAFGKVMDRALSSVEDDKEELLSQSNELEHETPVKKEASHEKHGSSSANRPMPSATSTATHTTHRQEANDHRVTNPHENARKRQSAMPQRKPNSGAIQRQKSGASNQQQLKD